MTRCCSRVGYASATAQGWPIQGGIPNLKTGIALGGRSDRGRRTRCTNRCTNFRERGCFGGFRRASQSIGQKICPREEADDLSCFPRDLGKKRKAGEGTRTLDIQLGKLALYQLSYARDARECSRSAGRSHAPTAPRFRGPGTGTICHSRAGRPCARDGAAAAFETSRSTAR